MPVEIKVALIALLGVLITGACSIVVQTLQNRKNQREILNTIQHQSEMQDFRLEAKIEKYAAVTDQKFETLTDEVRKHNNFAERIPKLETKIENIEHRVDGLEDK